MWTAPPIAFAMGGAVSACAPTLHALRVLRCHGMNDAALQTIYKAVVVAKLTQAASAWWGFTSADDRRLIEAVLRRGLRAGFYQSEWPTPCWQKICSL